MLVSVIMNGHNAAEYVESAIYSVLSQTYDEFELIFYDNCSYDDTQAIVRSFEDKRVKYYKSDRFLPLGEARNNAIGQSAGELIAFLDTDDLWLPTKLERQVPIFSDPNIGIVISDTIFLNNDRDVRQPFRFSKPPTGNVFSALIKNYFISLETAVVRKSALGSLDHMFDTRFQVLEEYDLFVRLSYFWELGYVDEVLGKWRMHSKSWTWTKGDLFLEERIIFVEKLKQSIPNFNRSNYPSEYKSLQRALDWDMARKYWKSGDNKSCRKLLSKYKFNSMKWFAAYLLSFLPFAIFQFVLKKFGRIAA